MALRVFGRFCRQKLSLLRTQKRAYHYKSQWCTEILGKITYRYWGIFPIAFWKRFFFKYSNFLNFKSSTRQLYTNIFFIIPQHFRAIFSLLYLHIHCRNKFLEYKFDLGRWFLTQLTTSSWKRILFILAKSWDLYSQFLEYFFRIFSSRFPDKRLPPISQRTKGSEGCWGWAKRNGLWRGWKWQEGKFHWTLPSTRRCCYDGYATSNRQGRIRSTGSVLTLRQICGSAFHALKKQAKTA